MYESRSRFNVAITGAGGGVGQSIIKCLYGTDYNLIGMDGEHLGTGLYSVPRAYKIPYSNHEKYIDTLMDISGREKCHLLFPGLDAELKPLALNREKFKAIGTHVVVSNTDVIDVADDKLLTVERLRAMGVSVPLTYGFADVLGEPSLLKLPFIVKQKVGGTRSKNVFLVKTEAAAALLKSNPEISPREYVAQEYIAGDEYTCGTVNLDGECRGVIVMRRILRDGDTYKCFVEKNSRIEEAVLRIVRELKPYGACNVQLRLKDGVPYVFEINARCSGTTAARAICGFNEPKMIADYVLKGEQPTYSIQGKTILRYWKEMEVDNVFVDKVKETGFLQSPNHKRL